MERVFKPSLLKKKIRSSKKNGTYQVYYYKTPTGTMHFTMSSYPMDSFEKQPSNAGTFLLGLVLVGLVLISTFVLIIATLIGLVKKGHKAETKGIRSLSLIANIVYIITIPLAFTYFSDIFGVAPTSWKISLYTSFVGLHPIHHHRGDVDSIAQA
jgi:hypothetical protein